MLADLQLPENVTLSRATPIFDINSVPAGLLKAHQIATEAWGILRVEVGPLEFALDDSSESRTLDSGDHQVIPPEVRHHVVPTDGARFLIEFYS